MTHAQHVIEATQAEEGPRRGLGLPQATALIVGSIIGVGIFGTLTGYLANLFLSPSKKADDSSVPDVQQKLNSLKDLVTQQQDTISELEMLIASQRR